MNQNSDPSKTPGISQENHSDIEVEAAFEETYSPPPPPHTEPEVPSKYSNLPDWAADLAALQGMDEGELSFSNVNIGDIPINSFLGDGISHTKNDITETSNVEFESTVQSFNRSVDAYHGAPMYVVKGPILNTRENRGFTRNVEMVGDMVPNILIGGTEESIYKISRMTTLNLESVEHSIAPPGTSHTPAQNLRFNLFNGQVLFVSETISQSISQPIVKFLNIDSDFRVAAGIKASVDLKDLLPCLTVLRQAVPEHNLVSAAIKTAVASRREPDIEFYRFPHNWLGNQDVPDNVKVFLNELHGTAPTLPEFPEVDQPKAIDSLVQQLRADEDMYTEELLRGLDIVERTVSEFTDSQKATLYQELMKSPVTRRMEDDSHVDVYETMYLDLHRPEHALPNSGLQQLAKTDPNLNLNQFAHFLIFDFEGRTYNVEFNHSGTYARLKAPNLVISLDGASDRLSHVLVAASHHLRTADIHCIFVEFEIALPSYCKSVVTRKARENHGFGKSKTVWNERILINLRYRGFWLVSSSEDTQISAWTRRINNQCVAETIHATLKPENLTVVALRRNQPSVSFLSLEEPAGRYIDGPDIRGTTILRPVANIDWSKPVNYPALYSGLGRILPTSLINLALSNSRVSIINLEEFLLGRDDLQFGLKDLGYPNEYRFRWEDGLNLKCASKPRALDWWSEMRKIPLSHIDSPAIEEETIIYAPSTSRSKPGASKQTVQNQNSGKPKKSSIDEANPKSDKPRTPNQTSGKGKTRSQKSEKDSTLVPKSATSASTQKSEKKGVAPGNSQKKDNTPVVLTPVTVVQVSSVDFNVGDWSCQYVQTCSIDERRYAASRCLDHMQHRKDWSAHINVDWVTTLLDYVQLPDFQRPSGSSSNWYIQEIPNMPLPAFLTYVPQGRGWSTLPPPLFESDLETQALPHWQRLPNGDIPRWMKKGRNTQPSIFTEILF